MKDLRVLFLSLYHPFDVGSGPGTHLRYLSQELAKLGCKVHILVPRNNTVNTIDGVYIHAFKSSVPVSVGRGIFFSFFSVKRIGELCKKYRIDLVHGQSPSSVGYACLHRNNLPFVVTLHSTPFGEMSSFFKLSMSGISLSTFYNGFIVQCLWTLLTSLECKRADKVIAVSKSLAKEIADFYNLPKNKVVAIHNGVNLSDDPAAEKHNAGPIILFVGRLIQEKGLEYLISAMPRILNRFPDARLQIVGDGNYKEYLENLSKKLLSDKSIDFAGEIPPKRLLSFYENASVVVQPSIYESCGIPILEAMSMQKPVVGARAGGIPELVRNGETGLLFEPKNGVELADAISTILSDASYAKKLGQTGRSVVAEHFTWEVVAQKTLELYEDIIESR